MLLAAGFLFGAARHVASVPALFSFLTLDLLRPAAFVGVQALLHPRPFRETQQWAELWQGAIVFVWVLLGFPFSRLLGLSPVAAAAASLGFGVLAVALVAVVGRERRGAQAPSSRANPGAEEEGGPDWDLDTDRVSPPDDWRERLDAGYEAYRSLDEGTRAAIDDLARWERIVLALEAAPETDGLPPYERTTPGLHLVTHAPYASIGPEIRRTNDRAGRILEQFGIPADRSLERADEPLVEGSMGPARGLDSPRAKSYELTEEGREVARRLREGLDVPDEVDLLQVLGEAYGDADE